MNDKGMFMKNYETCTDQELVKMYLSGDTAAFENLLNRHKNRVYNYILKIVKDRSLTEDLFQETFIKAIVNLKKGKYSEEGKFGSWINRVAFNLVMDYYRKSPQRPTIIEDEPIADYLNKSKMVTSSIQDHILYEDSLKHAVSIMNLLPEDQRAIVYMRFYQEMSFKEISETLDISINTALGRMRYAILNMQKLAKKNNIMDNLFYKD